MESQTTGDAKRRRLKARLSRRYSCSPHETLTQRKPFGEMLAINQDIKFPLVEIENQAEMLSMLISKKAWEMDRM